MAQARDAVRGLTRIIKELGILPFLGIVLALKVQFYSCSLSHCHCRILVVENIPFVKGFGERIDLV